MSAARRQRGEAGKADGTNADQERPNRPSESRPRPPGNGSGAGGDHYRYITRPTVTSYSPPLSLPQFQKKFFARGAIANKIFRVESDSHLHDNIANVTVQNKIFTLIKLSIIIRFAPIIITETNMSVIEFWDWYLLSCFFAIWGACSQKPKGAPFVAPVIAGIFWPVRLFVRLWE